MLHKRKKIIIIIVGIIVLISTLLTIYFIQQSRPKNVIESKLNLKLPSSYKIINYEYDSNGGYFDAKILFENNDIDDIKKQLDDFFGGVTLNELINDRPKFKNSAQWWDMDNKKIEAGYMKFVDVKKWTGTIMPHQVWVFITKDDQGKYYLYISY